MRAALLLAAALVLGAADKHSGYDDATPPIRAMQDDDSVNPGMLWVEQGETLWAQRPGAGPTCASCHGKVSSMRGVAARYPRFAGRVITLADQIEQCRTERQSAAPWLPESDEMLAMTALIGMQSRGLPMQVDASGLARAALAQGRAIFERRMGQLDLSCADCHDRLAGHHLGGSRIPQGQPNGYPEYRLEWQSLGSLERRLRNCMTGIRSEPFPHGSPQLAALEFYLGWRANGLKVETPAVRP